VCKNIDKKLKVEYTIRTMEKTEYIKQLKKLIKKYHPDLCSNKNLEPLHNEITKKLNSILSELKTNELSNLIKGSANINILEINNSITKVKDQDYEYYKLGIKYYKNIHPDQFYERNLDKTYTTKKYEDQLKVLNKIFISFDLSEYYFNKVITEYQNSPWKNDAEEKIRLLKKLHKSYENIEREENSKIIETERYIKEMGLKPLF
jgi:hypothetical protein